MHRPTVVTLIVITLVAALVLAGRAAASPWGDPRLDDAATYVAGHDVHVVCETDPNAWVSSNVFGYTYAPSRTHSVWLSPSVCTSLARRLRRLPNPLASTAIALHVLTHEATHQRGGIYADCVDEDLSCEGRTDCEALRHDEDVAVRFFGYRRELPRRIRQGGWVQPHGHVKNPTLVAIESYQRTFHREALPEQYQGGC
jgi:hypothetical protein